LLENFSQKCNLYIYLYLFKKWFLNQTEDSLSVERKEGKRRKSDSCNLMESLKEKKVKIFFVLFCSYVEGAITLHRMT
jgi:hypothetical protein